MKIIILVVMLFNYDGEGNFKSKTRHEFVQDSWAECQVVQRKTMLDYYQQPETSILTGINRPDKSSAVPPSCPLVVPTSLALTR